MKRTLTCSMALVAILALSSAGFADVVNYFDYEAGDFADTATGYVGGTGTATGVTVTGTGITYVEDATRGNVANLAVSGQINFAANDPDIALGSNYTVEMWVKSDNWAMTTTQDFIIANNYSVQLTSNHNWGSGTISVNANGSAAASGPRFAAGWLHVALVVSTDAGTFNLYINPGVAGERIIGGALAAGAGTTTSLRIGSTGTGYYVAQQLWLDDLTMYNEALSYDTLVANSVAGNPGLTPLGIPEPITLSLIGLGSLGMLLRRKQRA